ncbi:MAG: hypothetical protein GTN39_03640 [Candidatus Aenigmarchaeota archaeon]|nr:hypothetical protein [Candidatus Aenigmarchaeota archaeon]
MTLYTQELLNLDNPEEYRLALEIEFHSANPPTPDIEWAYYKEFGPREKFEEADSKLRIISEIAKNLRKELESSPENVTEVRKYIPEWGTYVFARRKREETDSKTLNIKRI